MTALAKATRWTATVGAAALLVSTSALPAQARPWPGDPQPPVRVSAPAALGHCPLARVGTRLVRCDNLTGAGVTAPRWVRVPAAAPR